MSTLHQKSKFIKNDKIIIIKGEEYVLVSHLKSFRYIEVEREIIETPFQFLDVVNVLILQKIFDSSKPELSMAYWQWAKAIIETENAQGWEKIIDVQENWDMFGLGYELSSVKANNRSSNK